ncbi:T9SS type A sorting domain-containing protein [Flavobacterium psychrotrophum]|uniref:T9SS type A sorting domain-containing protein n=1 Tax=Flavobacterium psychrotrophum TaxID=2294119 RepID=UPI000E30DC5B|nr:T9SS type A sorting domain-containing protein [Flavobacterium psychrotrophum]
MKKTLLLLLFSIMAYAQPQVNTPPDLVVCDANNDGVATFDLTTVSAVILGGLNPSLYTISYHETLADANADTNAIPFPQNYNNILADVTNGIQVLYVRVEENTTPTNFSIESLRIIVNPAPVINTPSAYTVCDDALPNDGFATFDLAAKNDEILGANAGLGFTVQYYTSAAAMEAGLALPSIYTNITPGTQTLFVKVTSIITGCTAYTTLTLNVNPLPEISGALPAITTCGESIDLTENALLYTNYMSKYYPTLQDAIAGTNEIIFYDFYPISSASSVWIKIWTTGDTRIGPSCYSYIEQPINLIVPTNIIISNIGNTLTIDIQGVSAPYQYALDNGTPQDSGTFYNVAYGSHDINYFAPCGGVGSITYLMLPSPPSGAARQMYIEGNTLADLDVEGQNILWYADADATTSLAETTIVTDGTTYYATQTIDTYQSPTFGVLVSRTAGTDTTKFSGFTYYPNPVKNNLTLHNNSEITKVEAYNLLGQLALSQNTSGTQATINMQALQPGVYMVKAYSGSNAKVIRVVKAE